MGLMSQAFGEKYVEQDYIMRLCRNSELAQEHWQTAPPHLKQITEAFTAGINAYVEKHPQKVPEHALELKPWMILTVGRAMILRWPLGTIQDDLREGRRRAGPPQGPPMRSNQWAVAPSRSADKIPILLADPHLSWEGLAVLYEARVPGFQPFLLDKNDVAFGKVAGQCSPPAAIFRVSNNFVFHAGGPQDIKILQHAVTAGGMVESLYKEKHLHRFSGRDFFVRESSV